jgi:phosphoglycolate phosphatase-like HAD superfamily hydrolase
MPIQHVCLFDIDGTLLSTGGAGRAAFEAALVQEFELGELRTHVEMSGRTDRWIAGDLFRAHDLHDSADNWRRLQIAYLKKLPEALVARPGRVLPGVMELLARITTMPHLAVGLLTGNMEAGARGKLGHFAIYQHFTFGAFGDQHLDRDSVAREALAIVQHRVAPDFPAENIWVIGDTPLDIQCARAIGAKAVAVATGVHSRADLAPGAPDLLAEDLSQIPELLNRWNIA